MASYKIRSIVLKNATFSEADKMVTLFSRERGKLKVIAKSSRKIPSRLGGRVEPFTYADFFIAQGSNIDIISQVEVLESFQRMRQEESTLMPGLYLLKLIESGTVIGQHNPQLFDLLLAALLELKISNDPRKLVKDFIYNFMRIEGIYKQGINAMDALSDHVGRDLRKW